MRPRTPARKGTASHLGDGTGIPVRAGHYAKPAARSQLPIGAIGPNEVRQWITMGAKRSLLKTTPQQAVNPGAAASGSVTPPGATSSSSSTASARCWTGPHPLGSHMSARLSG